MIVEIRLRCRFCPHVVTVIRRDGQTDMRAMRRHLHAKHAAAWNRLRAAGAWRDYLLTTSARELLYEPLPCEEDEADLETRT